MKFDISQFTIIESVEGFPSMCYFMFAMFNLFLLVFFCLLCFFHFFQFFPLKLIPECISHFTLTTLVVLLLHENKVFYHIICLQFSLYFRIKNLKVHIIFIFYNFLHAFFLFLCWPHVMALILKFKCLIFVNVSNQFYRYACILILLII